MADKTISELSAASALTGTELVPVVQGGATLRTTAQDIADLAGAQAGVVYVQAVNTEAKVANDSSYENLVTIAMPALAAGQSARFKVAVIEINDTSSDVQVYFRLGVAGVTSSGLGFVDMPLGNAAYSVEVVVHAISETEGRVVFTASVDSDPNDIGGTSYRETTVTVSVGSGFAFGSAWNFTLDAAVDPTTGVSLTHVLTIAEIMGAP